MKEKEEDLKFLETYDTVIEYTDKVEKVLLERPDARKKLLYQQWFDEINYYADKANKMAKYPLYGKIK